MNQFMSNLVGEGFHHVLLKHGHENAEMQKKKKKKENLMTSHFSTLYTVFDIVVHDAA